MVVQGQCYAPKIGKMQPEDWYRNETGYISDQANARHRNSKCAHSADCVGFLLFLLLFLFKLVLFTAFTIRSAH